MNSRPPRLHLVVAALVMCLSVVIHLVSAAQPEDYPEPSSIIRDEGQFVFTDGSSYYLLRKDGTFRSGPLGVSGREITGTWKQQDRLFVIEGRWGWLNGASTADDYRRMTIYVGAPHGVETPKSISFVGLGENAKVYKAYFIMEELRKTPPPKK